MQEKLATEKAGKADFDQLLAEAIDEALLSLGESVRTSIYFHLWDQFEIRKQEIPRRLGSSS